MNKKTRAVAILLVAVMILSLVASMEQTMAVVTQSPMLTPMMMA